MDYPQSLEFINSFINYEKTVSYSYPEAFKLDRMRAFAKELGNPQKSFVPVIIAGSKGKGSIAAILSSILRMESYRVGLYTSPHLVDLKERIRVNGLKVSEARFIEMAHLLRRTLDTPAWRKNPPTFFEVLTAMAFWHFKEMKVQIGVLEVGLGGLYDSTNIAEAKAVGLGPISLEHTDKLGKTVSKIAVQKCGVIKGREAVVSSPQTGEAEAVIQKIAAEREAVLYRTGKEIKVIAREYGEDFQKFDLKSVLGNYFDLELRLLGRHQIDNAAVAVGLAKALETKTHLKLSDAAVKQGVLDASWPGRLEKISDRPVITLDSAHHPESLKTALEGLRRHFHYRRLVVLFGVLQDKDLDGMLKELLPAADWLILTAVDNPRARTPESIFRHLESSAGDVTIEPDFKAAFRKAREGADTNDLVLITGSLYLVGDIKAALEKNEI